jgi:HAD superfamily hydrolase (TIGR01509 family)
MKSTSSLPAGVIFDMDGVLIDSNPFHVKKWVEMLEEHGVPYDRRDLSTQVIGQRNDTAFRYFFGPQLSQADIERLSEELEARFRAAFHPVPLPGLEALIGACHAAGVPMAVASSAMARNIEFVVDRLGLRRYFRYLVSGDEVSRPKPDPEVYLKTARKMALDPARCVAFEDSFVGLASVRGAGMKCVAIASTFPIEELKGLADLAVGSFEELSLERLQQLFVADSQRAAL